MVRRKHKPRSKRLRITKRRKTAAASRARSKARKPQFKNRKSTPKKRGRAKPVRKRPAKRTSPKGDPRIEAAVRAMNRGQSLTGAARDLRVSKKRLQSFVTQQRLAKRKGQRWITRDNRLRRVPVMTKGRFRIVTVRGYEQARLVGSHHHAVGQFVRSNALEFIKPFKGQSVTTKGGRRHILETDPNALHRIAAMDTPPFHEIYEITSNT